MQDISTSREVGQPIFFAVAIIIIVFLPIFTLREVEGKMFGPLAFSVTMTMVGSLVYAPQHQSDFIHAFCYMIGGEPDWCWVAPVFYSVFHKERGAERKIPHQNQLRTQKKHDGRKRTRNGGILVRDGVISFPQSV